MFTKDAQWGRRAWSVSDQDYPNAEKFLRQFTEADLGYHDTALGGNDCINPLPQFTRYADPPIKGIFNNKSTGMGGTYYEAFHKNKQVVHMRFGVPKYNSMTTFFSGFYNYRASVVARTGRVPQGFYLAGALIGNAAILAGAFVFPLFTAVTAGMAMFGAASRFYLNKPSSKYYYLKPTMTTYWTVAGIILNYLVVNMGYLSQQADESDAQLKAADNKGLTPEERSYMHEHMPDLFSEDGFIDIYAVATRAQRLARRQEEAMVNVLTANVKNEGKTWFGRAVNDFISGVQKDDLAMFGPTVFTQDPKKGRTLAQYLQDWNSIEEGRVQEDSFVEKDNRELETKTKDDRLGNGNVVLKEPNTKNDGFWKFLQAEFDDGGAFASFRVDYTGSVSESFSSSTAESEVKNKFNSVASSNRSSFFKVLGTEAADLPIIGGALSFIGNALKDTVGGAADATGMSGIMALGGSAFIDIPKHWQDSSFSGPKMSYSMTLDALYNHPLSRIMNQYLPLSMLLAGGIPLSVGKQSYTSPFICECYDRGRAASRLAIIRDISISRGNGNLGFLHNGISLSIDVSWTVEDLSTVMAAPVNAFYSANIIGSLFDDDTNFSDYMSVLTGMGLTDMIYPSNKVARNWRRNILNARRNFSPAYWGSVFGNKIPGSIMSVFYKGIDRQ